MDYTRKIADFVAQTRFDSIPPGALEVAKTALLDSVGVILAGSKEESARICAKLADEERSSQEATVIGQGFKSSTLMAAFSNGTAGHALDYDHSFSLMGQPTAGLVPAILVLGEKLGVNGRDILEAYVAGFEVTAKIARSLPVLSSQGGWHSVATVGSLGTAVACAKLLRLDVQAIQWTLGIASSMASGVVANFATMTKPLHAGLASRNGVLASRLAKLGFNSNPTMLGEHKGFYDAYSRDLPFDLHPFEELGNSFDLIQRGIKIKPYPCGGLTHTAIDAVLKMRDQYKISPQAVESIKVGVTQYVFNTISSRLPETALQGKFSMPYILARALIDGKLVLDTFSEEAVRDPLVRSVGEKIKMALDSDLRESNEGSRPCKVTIRQKDGRTLSERVEFPRGSRQVPLSSEELRTKFTECACRALNKEAAAQVTKMLAHLEDLDHLDPLFELLIGNPS
ncbi:MAG: MmgE/PrpD family protein [Deltaproteobacteria bacterium]|nr:MmgE/PrpD family protein [Deltaproteobacteria bacterium]MCZ6548835.1 MmgE/PrpD family protein [Deltaproteobacteria bacterium]